MSEAKQTNRNRRPITGYDLVFILLLFVPWLAGLVLAQGFWQTAFAVFPPYAWYLFTEHVMTITGFIAGCGA